MSLVTIDIDSLQLQPGERLLDLGCGVGRHVISAALVAPLTGVGVDLRAADLATTASRAAEFNPPGSVHVAQASGLQLPFADASFDVVICSEVLEHIHNYRAVLREITRVLRPGGRLAVSVPRYTPEAICWQLSQAYFLEEGGHLRIFEAGALRAAIETEGLVWQRRHWAHALHSPYWWLRCAFGARADDAWLVRVYHRLLVWDLMHAPWLTRTLERLLNPLLGKSVVLYFHKPGYAGQGA